MGAWGVSCGSLGSPKDPQGVAGLAEKPSSDDVRRIGPRAHGDQITCLGRGFWPVALETGYIDYFTGNLKLCYKATKLLYLKLCSAVKHQSYDT